MDLLQQARTEIDDIDAQMAALFERRMRAVTDVARYKAQTGKPVFDPVREAAVLDKNTARLQDEALRPYYRAFLQEAMAVSRAYQRAMLGRDTAAYQGVQGAWSHIALRRLFPFSRTISFATWGEVFDAVVPISVIINSLLFQMRTGMVCSPVPALMIRSEERRVWKEC